MRIKSKLLIQNLIPIFLVTLIGGIGALWLTNSLYLRLAKESLSSSLEQLKIELDQEARFLDKKIGEDVKDKRVSSTIKSYQMLPTELFAFQKDIQCEIISRLKARLSNESLNSYAAYGTQGLLGYINARKIHIVDLDKKTKKMSCYRSTPISELFTCSSKIWEAVDCEPAIPPHIDIPSTPKVSFSSKKEGLNIEAITPVKDLEFINNEVKEKIFGAVVLRKNITESFLSRFMKKTSMRIDLFLPDGTGMAGINRGKYHLPSEELLDLKPKGELRHVQIKDEEYYMFTLPYLFEGQLSAILGAYTEVEEVRKNIYTVLYFQVGILFFGMLVAGIFSIFTGRFIIRPIRAMTQQMNEVGIDKQEPHIVAIPSKDEIGILARAYNKMTTTLSQRNKEIESYIFKLDQSKVNLEASEKKYRSIFENISAGIFQFTEEGKILTANRSFSDMLGYKSPDNLISSISDIKEELFVNVKKNIEFFETIKRKGVVKGLIFKCYRKDQSIFTASINAHAVTKKDGRILYCEGILDNITEQEKAHEYKIARDAAEEATKAKNLFLANMSHEIRTPMNAILGMTELMFEKDLTADQLDFVQTIQTSGELLLDIINDILDFSKIEAGQVELEQLPFNLVDQVRNVESILRYKAEQKNIDLSFNISPGIYPYRIGDPTRISQILLNLVGNAIKFTHQGKVVLDIENIQGGTENNFLSIRVEDTGIGIPEDKQESIFRIFTQADTSTTRRFGGTGLGLAISKSLIEMMEGDISLVSAPGEGTVFSFSINVPKTNGKPFLDIPTPKHSESKPVKVPQINRSKEKTDEKESSKKALNPIKILLAEDIEANRKLILLFLELMPVSVTIAKNGEEAIMLFKANTFNLVLMDIQMPVLDGLSAMKMIRQWEKTENLPPVPIIALTAHIFQKEKDNCFQAGCSGFLSKPIKKNILINEICTQLGIDTLDTTSWKNKGKACDRSKQSDLCLDLNTKTEKKKEVYLPKDFEDLVPEFLEEIQVELKNIEQAIDTDNCEVIYRLGHGLKGAAYNYSFSTLAELFLKIEKAGECAENDIQKIVNEIRAYLENITILFH